MRKPTQGLERAADLSYGIQIVELQVAAERVYRQALSVRDSVDQGKIQAQSGLMGPHSLVGSVESPIPSSFPRIQ